MRGDVVQALVDLADYGQDGRIRQGLLMPLVLMIATNFASRAVSQCYVDVFFLLSSLCWPRIHALSIQAFRGNGEDLSGMIAGRVAADRDLLRERAARAARASRRSRSSHGSRSSRR